MRSPCANELTNSNAGRDNILTREEFYVAWTSLANHWCSATTSVADDTLFDELCCSCMDYDVGQFDAWCCMKVTFADSWVGIRMPDDMYPGEYAESLCDRIENRIRELHCTGDVSLSPEAPQPSESTPRPAVSPMPSAGDNQTISSEQSDSGFMNKLGEAMILALCIFLLMLLIGILYARISSRHHSGNDDDELSRRSETKSAQSNYARDAPGSESESPEKFDYNDFREGHPAEDYHFEEEVRARQSRVERLDDIPDNQGGFVQGATQEDLSADSEVEPRFFL